MKMEIRARLTLDLSSRLNRELERLGSEFGLSKASTLRLALSLFSEANRARNEGYQVGAWKQDGPVLREQVFLF